MENLIKALQQFQQGIKAINKNAQGYGYKYAPLDQIHEEINPILDECGLVLTHEVISEVDEFGFRTGLRSSLWHVESGEFRNSTIRIPENVKLNGMNHFQVLGSAITYYRRYNTECLLNLTLTKDTDAGEEVKPQPQPKSPAKKVSNNLKDLF